MIRLPIGGKHCGKLQACSFASFQKKVKVLFHRLVKTIDVCVTILPNNPVLTILTQQQFKDMLEKAKILVTSSLSSFPAMF